MPFPEKLQDRWAYILEKVKAGEYTAEWVPVTSSVGDLHAVFWVMADSLKVDGVRVNVSATLEQKIADVVGGMLMTGRVADLVYSQAQLRIDPFPVPITSSTLAMIEHSGKIDSAVAKLLPMGESCMGKLTSSSGKDWILDKKLELAPGRACNYGWHFVGTNFRGIKGYACVTQAKDETTQKPIYVIQPNATAHDPNHDDYSQTCRLMAAVCEVGGVRMLTKDLLSDAKLAPLLSHTGVLKFARQPGVPSTEIVMPLDVISGKVFSPTTGDES